MRMRPSSFGRAGSALLPLGILVLLAACSSSESSPGPENDAAVDVSEAGAPDVAADAGSDAPEPGSPPPYDFAVACTATPCVTRIAARGGSHVCVVLEDGTIRCWGANESGQLGSGDGPDPMPEYVARPRAVPGLSNVKSIAATGSETAGTTCAVTGAGAVLCFGSDVSGQLGRSATDGGVPDAVPAPVEGVAAKSVTLTNTFALAIGTDDRLWSWGANDLVRLGRTEVDSPSPAARADRIANAVRSCAGTTLTGFAVTEDGAVLSWGGGTSDQLGRDSSVARDPMPFPIAVMDVSAIVTGAAHACALSSGRVQCWGENDRGQLGTGTKAEERYPVLAALPADAHVVAVAAGGANTCAIVANGDVYCWGANASSQMATAAGLDQRIPIRIAGLGEQAVAVAVMDDAICALLRSGSVACWGDNRVGQLGRGSRDAELHPQPAPVVFE